MMDVKGLFSFIFFLSHCHPFILLFDQLCRRGRLTFYVIYLGMQGPSYGAAGCLFFRGGLVRFELYLKGGEWDTTARRLWMDGWVAVCLALCR